MNVLKTLGKVIVVAGLIVLVVLGVMQLQKFATAPREQFLQGQMEARRVLVAGKVPGRIERLFVHEGDLVVKDSIVAVISSPEIEAKKMQAQGALGAARAQASKARNGARSEDKAAANALVMQARGATAEVDAYLEETKIRSPISGEVSLKLAEEGEVVGSGMPVIAVTDLDDAWAVFHLREDMLKNVSKGKKFVLRIPALDKDVEMEVSYIASVGDYATWRSSKESGGFDLKTFEVRLRPTAKVENLRPGMSVLLSADSIK